jgi:hypothetical protein
VPELHLLHLALIDLRFVVAADVLRKLLEFVPGLPQPTEVLLLTIEEGPLFLLDLLVEDGLVKGRSGLLGLLLLFEHQQTLLVQLLELLRVSLELLVVDGFVQRSDLGQFLLALLEGSVLEQVKFLLHLLRCCLLLQTLLPLLLLRLRYLLLLFVGLLL